MKSYTALLLVIAVTGCTTMQPIGGGFEELQQSINSGDLLKPGDRVRIVTADQKVHWFAISKIEAGLIVGPHESLPVDQVMYVEKRQFQTMEFPVWIAFDKEVAVDSLIAIAAFALKPISVKATP